MRTDTIRVAGAALDPDDFRCEALEAIEVREPDNS
jgi:hypothetical protein